MRELATKIADKLATLGLLIAPEVDAVAAIEKILYEENMDAIYTAAKELIAKMENQ